MSLFSQQTMLSSKQYIWQTNELMSGCTHKLIAASGFADEQKFTYLCKVSLRCAALLPLMVGRPYLIRHEIRTRKKEVKEAKFVELEKILKVLTNVVCILTNI